MFEFEEERRGYNKEQVETYCTTLKNEYQSLLSELDEAKAENEKMKDELDGCRQKQKFSKQLRDKLESEKEVTLQENRELSNRIKTLELSENPSYSEAIASALVSAEMSARQIITNAEKEAQLIGEDATRNLSDIIQVKQSVVSEVKVLTGKLLKVLKEDQELKENISELPEGARKDGSGREEYN